MRGGAAACVMRTSPHRRVLALRWDHQGLPVWPCVLGGSRCPPPPQPTFLSGPALLVWAAADFPKVLTGCLGPPLRPASVSTSSGPFVVPRSSAAFSLLLWSPVGGREGARLVCSWPPTLTSRELGVPAGASPLAWVRLWRGYITRDDPSMAGVYLVTWAPRVDE